jgi:CRP/FNR family nitrogen fixation transcriptional regulator
MLTHSSVLDPAIRPLARYTSPSIAPRAPEEPPGHNSLVQAMQRAGIVVSHARCTEIFGDDEPADHLYKVIRGAVCTYKILSDGRRQISEFYLPGECFGLEYAGTHSHSAEAITDAKTLVIKKTALMKLADRDATIVQQLLDLTAVELARVQDRVLLLAKTAEERVVGFLLDMAKRLPGGNSIELPMLRQDIADYLGLTIETVSRTLKSLKDNATIEVSTRHVVLRDWPALSRLNG